MKTIIIIGSTGVLGQCLVTQYKNENCIEVGRNLPETENSFPLDLSDFESILYFLNQMKKISVDILFLNSGVFQNQQYTRDGIEYNFMVNAFGPYFLVKHFLNHHPNCRVVVTSSVSILHAKEDFVPKRWKNIYRNTKWLEHALLAYLHQEVPSREITFAHPGIVYSKLSVSLHSFWVKWWIKHFGNSKEQAVLCLIKASEVKPDSTRWICPSGWFSLRGTPKSKKIKKEIKLTKTIQNRIFNLEKEIEEKYGILCNGL